MLICVFSIIGFLRLIEVINVRADVNIKNNHIAIFILKSKTDVYREESWVYLTKLIYLFKSDLFVCLLDITDWPASKKIVQNIFSKQ